MTFNKPPIKYTDMAIWVDTYAYQEDCDQNKLYQYIYHLVNMQAHKNSLFVSLDDYDQYSLFCASRLVLRIHNTKNSDTLKPIKSILNYIKTILHPWRADYEREFHIMSDDYDIVPFGSFDLGDYMVELGSYHDSSAFSFTCDDVASAIETHMKRIPRKRCSAEWTNIYISCLLTLQDRIQFAIDTCNTRGVTDKYKYINDTIQNSRLRKPILFHIEEFMANYINVLVIEIMHAIAAELTHELTVHVSPKSAICDLIISSIGYGDD